MAFDSHLDNIPTTRNRLSFILQFASPSISRTNKYSRRPAAAPVKAGRKSSCNRDNDSVLTSVVSAASDSHHRFTAATASTASVADTLLSTPHEALLGAYHTSQSTYSLPSVPPSPIHPSEPIPPTTNDLDAEEKMRLMKKVRKLSQVLGEYPIPVSINSNPAATVVTFNDTLTSENSQLSPSSTVSSPSTTSKHKVLKRSVTVGYTGGSQGTQNTDIHAKSFTATRPSLAIPTSPSHLKQAEHSSTAMCDSAQPTGSQEADSHSEAAANHASLSSSEIALIAIAPVAGNEEQRSSPSTSRQVSPSSSHSSILALEQTPGQVRRARAQRFTRQLGDNVLPDVLLRAASPLPRAPSPLPSSLQPLPPSPFATQPDTPSVGPRPTTASGVLESQNVPRRSSSLRRRKQGRGAKKRLSLDIRAFTGTGSAPSTPAATQLTAASSSKGPAKFGKDSLRRSRSMWGRMFPETNAQHNSERLETALSPMRESFDTGEASAIKDPISEKQRIRNVRRAAKMTQLFGDQPPTALFQITNFSPPSPILDIDDFDRISQRVRRDSLATIISLSASTLSLTSSNHNLSTDVRRVRDSYMSISSIVTSSSGVASAIVVFEQDHGHQGEMIGKQAKEVDADADGISSSHQPSSGRPHSPSQLPDPSPVASLTPIKPSPITTLATTSPSSPPPQLSKALHRISVPRTPPPFSDVFVPVPVTTPRPSTPHVPSPFLSTPEFHVRQRRAAKLSKFFGVGLNDLAEVLPPAPAVNSELLISTSDGPYQDADVSDLSMVGAVDQVPHAVPAPSTTVEVSTELPKGPLRFLGKNNMREVDMYDAIDQLRRMKSM